MSDDPFYGGINRDPASQWRGDHVAKAGSLTVESLTRAYEKLRDGEPEVKPYVEIVSERRHRVMRGYFDKYPNHDAPLEAALWARYGLISENGEYRDPTPEEGKMIVAVFEEAMARMGWL